MRSFSYHRSLAPMLWTLVAISLVEMATIHLLIALWRPWVGAILSLASVAVIVWLVRLIRSFRRLPVLVGEGHVLMRAGTLHRIDIPAARIAGLRSEWSAASLKDRSIARLSLLAYPNVIVELNAPIRGRRGRLIHAVAHRLDDPAAFSAALTELQGADGHG
ncbi:hypothetical protein HL653_14580 [Sphingomonas sp. AP4-R1]|uniref:hypothetical protein n=1 Tax=Sphingomonas sp. AP4-R1 TaxID=2735134 RepID=UPI0014934A09|nr:hypothetical protein [Sphingomonas sp. AP4-R1]QJU58829.1 hypothetical protein HL653_14580 [Sphingomonas sp. AP4-R1]